jgi:hypothetical protein
MRIVALLAVFAISALPAFAQSGSGTSGLQYYVGTWSCTGGPVGQSPNKATITYTLDSGVLHQTIAAPKQGTMKTAYVSSASTTYDAKGNRYITGGVSNDPASFTSMWTLSGNVETSRDTWTSSGKPGHGQTIRNSNSMFTYTGYSTLTSTKPSFKAVCRRGS